MKILCVIDQLESGGAQRQLVQLALGFKEKGHEVSFLTYHPHSFYAKALADAGISEICIQESNYIKRLLKMRRFIRRGNYDAVISFLIAANLIATVSGFPFKKWRLIVGERSGQPANKKSWRLYFFRWFHLWADEVVANSQKTLKSVKKDNPLLSKNKLKVIYNIVEIPKEINNNIINKSLSYKTKLIIGARFVKLKNLNGLIEAVNLLPDNYKEQLQIDWYGSTGKDGSLEAGENKINQYKLNTIINLHPPTQNLLNKITQADAVGLFSFYESFPNLVCEGLALGKPIICTPVSDLPKLLKENENAFFCKPDDPKTIKESIKKVIDLTSKEKKNIELKNKRIAQKNFKKPHIIQEYLNILSSEV